MKKQILFILVAAMFLSACGSKKKPAEEVTDDSSSNARSFQLEEVWRTDTLLRVPESVIYDKETDVIYVSNLNYEPRVKDGNGFISRLSTEGEILELKWVEDMSSPKGLAIYKGDLFVSDIDEVIVINIAKGEIIDRVAIPGAKMINDITVDDLGNLYVSDSDDNSIFLISNGVVSKWLSDGLNAPNGLLIDDERLLLASMGSQDFAAIDLGTQEVSIITKDVNLGDGIASASIPGHFLVSDWAGEVFLVYPDGTKISLLDTKAEEIGAADIDFIAEKNLLIVPTFFTHTVVAYKLVEKE